MKDMFSHLTKWKCRGDLNGIPKSIIVVAPHTSYWDAVIGKCFLIRLGVKYVFLSKKDLFRFPFGFFMKAFGAIPIGNNKGHNAINDIANMLQNTENLHVIICPEGGFPATKRWNPGFYYMALKANVPIVVAYIDYGKKEVGIKGVITNLSDKRAVYKQLTQYYNGVTARHPENFELPQTDI